MGSTAPSVMGLKNLLECQAAARGAGLRLAVAHHAGGDEVGVVHDRPEGVGQGVAQLAPSLMEPGVLGGRWLGMPPGKENCRNSRFMPSGVLADVGIDLAVRAVQIVLGHHGVAAVAGAGEIDHIRSYLTMARLRWV